jgi:hypothetical protein
MGVNTAVATKDGVQEAAGAIASLASNLARRFLPDDNARPDVAPGAIPKRPKHRGAKRRKAKRRNHEVVAHA